MTRGQAFKKFLLIQAWLLGLLVVGIPALAWFGLFETTPSPEVTEDSRSADAASRPAAAIDAAAVTDAGDGIPRRAAESNGPPRTQAERAPADASVRQRIAAMESRLGRCADPPLGDLGRSDERDRYAAWLECRRSERDALQEELQAIRASAEPSLLGPDVRRNLEDLAGRVEAADASIMSAERSLAEARTAGGAPGTEDWAYTPSRQRSSASARSRDGAPRCTCDDARRGLCGSPATHCVSDAELAARRRAAQRAAASAELGRRERQALREDREERRAEGAREAAAADRVLESPVRGQGTTRVEACHNARASAVHAGYAPLLFSHYRDYDAGRDQLCSCRRDGDTWSCESTAVYGVAGSLADRWPNQGFSRDDSRARACTEAKAASIAITQVTSARLIGYRIVSGADDNCRCERNERLDQWECSAEAWLSR